MKNYIPSYEDFVNEDILNDPDAKLWDTKYRINYDDLPANMNLTTDYLNVLFKGIPYQHYAFPQVSDDGNLIFKNQRDLDKAKKILSGKVKSVNEGDMTKFYDGFKVLDFKNKETYKFKYIKGISNAKVEVDAINKLVKATGISQANFTVHGFVKRGEWNKDDTQVLEYHVNEAQFFKATKDFEEFLEEIDGMPEVRIKRIMGNKYIDTPGGFRDEADDYDNDIVEYMIANMGRKEFEKLKDYWETNIKESSTFVAESAMGDVHIMAEEAKTFDEFKAEFIKEYGIGKKDNNKELHNWLQGIWKENHKK
jgi:hypothetical protein